MHAIYVTQETSLRSSVNFGFFGYWWSREGWAFQVFILFLVFILRVNILWVSQILVLCWEMEKLEIGLVHLKGIRVRCGVAASTPMLYVLHQAQLILQRMLNYSSMLRLWLFWCKLCCIWHLIWGSGPNTCSKLFSMNTVLAFWSIGNMVYLHVDFCY